MKTAARYTMSSIFSFVYRVAGRATGNALRSRRDGKNLTFLSFFFTKVAPFARRVSTDLNPFPRAKVPARTNWCALRCFNAGATRVSARQFIGRLCAVKLGEMWPSVSGRQVLNGPAHLDSCAVELRFVFKKKTSRKTSISKFSLFEITLTSGQESSDDRAPARSRH